ncbi:2,3-bisphosphoglycerate-independent phosphoglycerate mutase [Oceanisphaera arctica]|uniref:2,3-bisphosphoglycerate-independent phosphoglycerate mutase n=1 Tax=Oceanisphaera arctica TaxID=641510 RepID=A0A2P5TIN9_9GAMM|nr:2,3-bisphosphoglycerate-independent phosphoglycerate mutase [Oceanisphaera arctica]PPL14672.1 phosphoglycerate mutase (2,3-diphosphoglycerate-independent) [Oceanisphaera arctica]GHA15651.1 2,3-bisphosphoglycerate-independent phosphoglycerate mutase [Oceanisphaera arctica]
MNSTKKPLVLIIMDGWGYSEKTEHNAIHTARTPVLDGLMKNCPSMLISTSGHDVGLPDGQMGNSEVGHVNIGAGRIVYQDLTRIDKAIENGDFFTNPVLTAAVDGAVGQGKAVHIMGLLSAGGVHSHEDQIAAMVRMAAERGAERIYLHGFLDGRDVAPRSAQASIERFDTLFATLGKGRLASIVGRYFAMDRDNRWDRVQNAYDLLTQGRAEHHFATGVEALQAAYAREENDEFVKATTVGEPVAMQDGDAVIFMNFRADRARELTRAFVQDDFTGFKRTRRPALSNFVMLTEYAADIHTACAYPPESLPNTLGEWLAAHGKTQLRISETEKYAHVTFFFNGGREECFAGEQRELIPSPQVATYDLQPEMNAELLTDKLVAAIRSQVFDVIICNYPNGDMVGHTGVFEAAVKACEAVDRSIGRVVEALEEVGGEALITADHGNAEQMVNPVTGLIQTAHTNLPVPLIYVGRDAVPAEKGRLSDLAPTMLTLLGMETPTQMTGKPLMVLK